MQRRCSSVDRGEENVSRCTPTGAATITLGVDTHKDFHVGVALDGLGRSQGTLSVAANLAGYKQLVQWASEFGHLEHAGVEGTGSFGAGLTRFLKAEGISVFEVPAPNVATNTEPASPTHWMPRQRLVRCLQAQLLVN